MFTNSFVMPNNMSDLCRVCLLLPEESQYLDLTTIYDEEENLTYGECFTICTQIDLSSGEGVPHNLCKSCGLELQMSYDFHKKIEESKRVIDHCQRQLKVQNPNASELPTTSVQCINNNINEKVSTMHIIDEKYVISDEDEHLRGLSESTEEECELQQENEEERFMAPSYVKEDTDEMEIINNICHTETNLQNQDPSHENNSSLIETMNENDEDHIEIGDYQNLEALEEEETETLQIKFGENIIPINVTKFKTVGRDEIIEYVEYVEDFNEDKETREELDEEYAQEINTEDTKDPLRWKENVVAVANREHLPITIERDKDEGEEGEEGTTYLTSKCKNNTSQEIIESSQDETFEDEEDEAADISSNINENNNSNNNNNNNRSGRKRHVGSYSCDYCHRVYPNYSRMKTHRRCHEVDRPKFTCSHCGRIYATKQARDCHIQTAHDKSGYTCSFCSKVFAIRKSLEIHIRYHTGEFPYACTLCDRKFAQACHLNTHINVKHNKIRFSCEYPNCGKYFTSSSSLRNHEYTHGIMPFECEYCQQGYPAKSKLRIHIQRKHGIDISNDELENMRKFHIMRSKVNLVQFVDT